MFLFNITSVTELGLGANTKLPIDRLKWTTDCKSSGFSQLCKINQVVFIKCMSWKFPFAAHNIYHSLINTHFLMQALSYKAL